MKEETTRPADQGFTLPELLVATVLALLVVGSLLSLVNPAGHAASAQPSAVDLQQRVRIAAASLYRDLYAAGAGFDHGQPAGPLARYLPPIVPRRIGAVGADASGTARPDTISLVFIPEEAGQSELLVPFSGATATLLQGPHCPAGQSSCGFRVGAAGLILDTAGRYNLFTVVAAQGSDLTVDARGPALSSSYGAGSGVAEIRARTYYFDAAARQLRQYDTDRTDVAFVDDVTDFRLEYLGTPEPPTTPMPPPGEANCLYDGAGTLRGGLPTLAAGAGGLAPLPLSMFGDGPWCGTGATEFDADLLRIRQVRVTIGAQASDAAVRVRGPGFASPGISRNAWRRVPDIVVSFTVTPRNANLD